MRLTFSSLIIALCSLMVVSCGGSSSGSSDPGMGMPTPIVIPGGFIDRHEVEIAVGSYLGGGSDAFVASAAAPNATWILAGNFSTAPSPVTNTIGNGDGYLIQLSLAADTILSVTQLDGTIEDLAVAATSGHIAVTGSFGSRLLSAGATSSIWNNKTVGEDVAISRDGTKVVVTQASNIHIYDQAGMSVLTTSTTGAGIADVAINSADNLCYVVGYTQVSANLQQPWLRALFITGPSAGTEAWDAWDWSALEAQNEALTSDARAVLVHYGADNRLYVAGRTTGGISTFNREPDDLSTSASFVQPDAYHQLINLTAGRDIVSLHRFNASTGDRIDGTWLLTRLSTNKSNGINAQAITATSTGEVTVGGRAQFQIAPVGEIISIASTGIDSSGAGPYICHFDNTWNVRSWVTLSPDSTGDVTGLASTDSELLIVTDDMTDSVVQFNALGAGLSDAWFSLLSTQETGMMNN